MNSKSSQHHPGLKFYDSMNSEQTSVLKRSRRTTKRLSKAQREQTFFLLPQVFLRHLGASFRVPVGPNLTRVWNYSLSMGQKSLLDGDNLAVSNRLESVILASVHTLVPLQVSTTVDTHGRDHFKNQIIKRNVLFWAKKATCSQVFHSWTWANTDITASLLLFLRLFTANFVPSMWLTIA